MAFLSLLTFMGCLCFCYSTDTTISLSHYKVRAQSTLIILMNDDQIKTARGNPIVIKYTNAVFSNSPLCRILNRDLKNQSLISRNF